MYQNKFYLILLLALLSLAACMLPAKPATTPSTETAAVRVVATTDTGRTIRHHLGETKVPLAPQRIVSLDVADNLLTLGITPIAVGDWEQSYLSDALADVPTVGSALEPNLELISSLTPDLILLHTEGDFALDQYDLLNQIAPAVVVTDPEENFRLSEREVGLVLGQAEAVEARIAEYEARIGNARTQVADRIGDGTVALVNVRQDHYRLYGIKVGYTGPFLYGELGMTPAALVQELVTEDANIHISLETLPRLDADSIFVLYQTTLTQQWQELQAQPLWQALPAVQAGHVYTLTGNYWYASGLLAHEAKIADVLRALERDTTSASAVTTPTLFPLTITDAAGQEFTFDAPPKIGCGWLGCEEILADLGVAPHASYWIQQESIFLTPAGLPTHTIADMANPEQWAAAEIDLLIKRGPATPNDEALTAAAPIFYLHFPSADADAAAGIAAYYENTRLLGQLTGKPDVADAILARFDAVQAKLRTLATAETRNLRVAVLFGEATTYRTIGNANPFCTVLAAVELGQCIEAPWWEELNAEAFLGYDPDWIVYMDLGWPALVTGNEALLTDRTDPVWPQLTAVKAGRVYKSATQRFDCCSTRMLTHALQDYVSHVLPDAGIPTPGPLADFDPAQSPLVTES